MKCKLFWTIILSALLVSCNNTTDNTLVKHSSFKEVLSLTAMKVEVPPTLLYPRGIYLLDDRIIVFNEKTDTLFQVFGLPDMTYQGQWGIKGGGPEDFVLPLTQPVSSNESSVVLSDRNKLKRISFNKGRLDVETKVLPFDYSYYNGLQCLRDSSYCCFAGFEDEKEFMLLQPNKQIKKFGTYPENVSPRFKNVLSRNQAYTSFLVANPDGNRLAVFYHFLRRWRIYNNEGELISDNCMDVQPMHPLPKLEDEERIIHPIAVYASENYIYTLNLDMTAEEIGRQIKNPTIQVFDWNGCPLKLYELDCYISSFVVDEKSNHIYGVFAEDIDHIYKFSMN